MRRRGGSDHPRILSLMSCHRPAVWTVDVIAALPLSSLRSSPTVNESFPVIGQQLDVMSLDTEEAPRTRRKAEASGDSDGGGRGSFPLWPLGPRAPSDSGSLVDLPACIPGNVVHSHPDARALLVPGSPGTPQGTGRSTRGIDHVAIPRLGLHACLSHPREYLCSPLSLLFAGPSSA